MTQQVNLYHPIFRKQQKQFSATAMLQSAGVLLAGILLLYAYNAWQVRGQRAALVQAQAQHTAAVKRLAEVSQKFVRAGDPELAAEVERLEQDLAVRAQLVELLQSGTFGNQRGYSAHFVALARQHLPGIWLTGFDIRGSGEKVGLEGRTTAPELVPRYLQRLATEPPFAHIEFHVFQMRRPEVKVEAEAGAKAAAPAPPPAYIEFAVKTAAEEAVTPP